MRRTLPLPALLLAVAGAVVFLQPGMNDILVYDRAAIASGQLWRLATGHLVHFSTSHVLWNLLVLVFAGWALKDSARRGYGVMLFSASVMSGMALFLFQPSIVRYGGLSGLATASVVYLCLVGMQWNNPARWIWAMLLILTAVKITVEAAVGHPLFADPGVARFELVPLVHLVGGVTAGLFWVVCVGMSWRKEVIFDRVAKSPFAAFCSSESEKRGFRFPYK